ncbi:MAG: ribosome maturation factor RimM [Alphaproteobacteria bacterium]
MTDKRICLGAIAGVHGIKGEVKLKSFTQNPKDIANYGTLTNKDETKSFDIKIVGYSKELLRAKIKGVDDRTLAETLIGTELWATRDVLPELDEEEFYYTDLVDLKVILNGQEVGKVLGVHNFGSGDVLDVSINGQSEMYPFTKAYVPEVNVKEGFVTISELLEFEDDED